PLGLRGSPRSGGRHPGRRVLRRLRESVGRGRCGRGRAVGTRGRTDQRADGAHTGEPRLTEEGYVGLDVHKAAELLFEVLERTPRVEMMATTDLEMLVEAVRRDLAR